MHSIKSRILTVILIIACLGGIVLLNSQVTTQKCINYKCREIKIPLYLKLLNFFDRHFNYKLLAREITAGAESEDQKAIAIFHWVTANIRPAPEGFPIIDDHIWNIIIRGYGTSDQHCDVFSTLCNYAGLDALYLWVDASDTKSRISLSLAKISGEWGVFDPYNGVYFMNSQGGLAKPNDLTSGNWSTQGSLSREYPDYAIYLPNLPQISESGLHRSNIQSPLKRLIYQFKKKIR